MHKNLTLNGKTELTVRNSVSAKGNESFTYRRVDTGTTIGHLNRAGYNRLAAEGTLSVTGSDHIVKFDAKRTSPRNGGTAEDYLSATLYVTDGDDQVRLSLEVRADGDDVNGDPRWKVALSGNRLSGGQRGKVKTVASDGADLF